MERLTKFALGDTVYSIVLPSETNVICENAYYDRNYNEQGKCKYNCYKHCRLPQAKIIKVTVKSVHVDMDIDGEWQRPNIRVTTTYNDNYTEEMLFSTYEDARNTLIEEVKRQHTYWMGGGTPLVTLELSEDLYYKLMNARIVTVESAKQYFTDRRLTDRLSLEEINELGAALS